MKNICLVATLALIMTSCTQEKKTIVEEDGTTTSTTKIELNDPKLDSAKTKINNELDETGEAIEKGAKQLKEDVKDATSEAAAAVEKGAKKVKEDTEK